MIVARGLGRGLGRIIVTAGLGLLALAPELPPGGGTGTVGGHEIALRAERDLIDQVHAKWEAIEAAQARDRAAAAARVAPAAKPDSSQLGPPEGTAVTPAPGQREAAPPAVVASAPPPALPELPSEELALLLLLAERAGVGTVTVTTASVVAPVRDDGLLLAALLAEEEVGVPSTPA